MSTAQLSIYWLFEEAFFIVLTRGNEACGLTSALSDSHDRSKKLLTEPPGRHSCASRQTVHFIDAFIPQFEHNLKCETILSGFKTASASKDDTVKRVIGDRSSFSNLLGILKTVEATPMLTRELAANGLSITADRQRRKPERNYEAKERL
jgi:hypothetical protein